MIMNMNRYRTEHHSSRHNYLNVTLPDFLVLEFIQGLLQDLKLFLFGLQLVLEERYSGPT